MILVYTTHESSAAAKTLSEQLLKERLIACVNYSSIEACLVWKGEKTSTEEVVALYKTSESALPQVEKRYLELHPYEVPCFIVIQASANKAYEDWVEGSTI